LWSLPWIPCSAFPSEMCFFTSYQFEMASSLNSCASKFAKRLCESWSFYLHEQVHNGWIKLLMNVLAMWENINCANPCLDALFGIPYLHVLLHKLLIWDGFLFEFMWFTFCKMLVWKLINLFAQTGAWWLLKAVDEYIMHLKNINFAKHSLDSLFRILYLHVLIYEILIWDGFLFEFMCRTFWEKLMQKLINIFAETGAECMGAKCY
jgi:hypothetical protein